MNRKRIPSKQTYIRSAGKLEEVKNLTRRKKINIQQQQQQQK